MGLSAYFLKPIFVLNHELKLVVLSTMNPINNFFFSHKGGCRFLKLRTPQLKPLKIKNEIVFLKICRICHNNCYQHIWKWDFFNFQPTLLLTVECQNLFEQVEHLVPKFSKFDKKEKLCILTLGVEALNPDFYNTNKIISVQNFIIKTKHFS